MLYLDMEEEFRHAEGYTMTQVVPEGGKTLKRYGVDRSCTIPFCGTRLSRYNPDEVCSPCAEKAVQLGESWLEGGAFRTFTLTGRDKILALSPQELGIKILTQGEEVFTADMRERYGSARQSGKAKIKKPGIRTIRNYAVRAVLCELNGIKPPIFNTDRGRAHRQIRCMDRRLEKKNVSIPKGRAAKALLETHGIKL